ncbi:MAG: GTP 3',8-cyclase MoaA [Chitinophagales bacterium]|nr:GTP 3',8-cyclase MoaA [Chitinophagales bacterium]
MLIDSFGRKIDYLRLSVTDRCDLRCRYCMPEGGIDFSRRDELLSFEEISTLSKIFSELGIVRVRLTGGEPFIRKDIMQLIRSIRSYYQSFNITTNATKLHLHLEELKELEIHGLNISIDSLDADKFKQITRRDAFDKVISNIYLAIESGFKVKLNVVVLRGINDNEILDFVDLTRSLPVTVRFIEAMPFNGSDGNKDQFIPFTEILAMVEEKYLLKNIDDRAPSSSVEYNIDDHLGKIAVIPAYSRSLCGSCNRLRLTAKGEILNCLYSNSSLSLKNMLRSGMGASSIKQSILDHIMLKRKSGFDEENQRSNKDFFEPMTTIGG